MKIKIRLLFFIDIYFMFVWKLFYCDIINLQSVSHIVRVHLYHLRQGLCITVWIRYCCPEMRGLLNKHVLASHLLFIWTSFKNTNVKNNISLQWACSSDGSFSNRISLRLSASSWLKSYFRIFSPVTYTQNPGA